MNMEIMKKYKVLLVLVLVIIMSAFFFFYRMYNHDIEALTDFVASYEKFDKAISDFSIGKTDDLESKAGDALIELNAKAAFRLSSLIKNDGVIPPLALEIADFSGKELDTLNAYTRAIQSKNADLGGLAKEYGDLTSKRKTAYARFRGLEPK
jgi:hypothetical protein